MMASDHPGVRFDPVDVRALLCELDQPCFVVRQEGRIGVVAERPGAGSGTQVLAAASPVSTRALGAPRFLARHGVRQPYMAGSMAGGISSEELVVALARSGHLASFGAAGLPTGRVEQALRRLRRDLPDLPWACNLIHDPADPASERRTVDLCLHHQVACVEASAFLQPTAELVRYRAAGLRWAPDGAVHTGNRVIAKVSQPSTAEFFLRPPPAELLTELAHQGRITAEQAELAARVALADDITVEADSAGHTDRRPLVTQLPLIIALRDREAAAGRPGGVVGVGAAGGIGTPQAAFGAFAMGADYIVTGSINQACAEAGTSPAVKTMLAEAGPGDYAMAPAADMFEMGVDVQVLKRGTLFPGRAAWLYRLYREHASLEDLPASDLKRLEEQILRRPVGQAWSDVAAYLAQHRPDQAALAAHTPKLRMALLFRWYLGLSSRWAAQGAPDRGGDYQIWCGPAMSAFNAWVRGTLWQGPDHRHAPDIARALLSGAAYHSRLAQLRFAGVGLPSLCGTYPAPGAVPPAGASLRPQGTALPSLVTS
ncbi:PfaD family polyunsaturated fatty acid/polyketide biosynthesis protein [Streptomyces sp. NRRL S-920]|uniref:PfaD family polyunsaturated fatty acid/polyketide biosynthesis protein n=1 Tax=Streptomyces sp. NRRL S-920 TaxID=1463921 RepID=UPI000691187A|nr:PfaD family polyunsaturated fatty acid/polyketide biosynthesis protein [Streptomyces sp. NRRL S-920]